MKMLFIHQNFPGQFRHIAAHLAKQPDVQVLAIGREQAPGLPGVCMLRYKPHRTASAHTHPYARSFEDGVLHGQQVLRVLLDLKAKGYRPDVIVAHPGWGETLYAKEAFPNTKLIHFCEYYYQTQGADTGFDPEFPLNINGAASIRSRNALHLLNCDAAITSSHWQHSLHPKAYQDKIQVIQEGIDTSKLRPDREATLQLPNGKVLRAGEPIVTYVARNLEPYRGFHSFMRALPLILNQHPTQPSGGGWWRWRQLRQQAQGRAKLVDQDAKGKSGRSRARALSWQGALRHIQKGAASLCSTRLSNLSLCALLVIIGSHGQWLLDCRFGYRTD